MSAVVARGEVIGRRDASDLFRRDGGPQPGLLRRVAGDGELATLGE
jgi:hypothetical protein